MQEIRVKCCFLFITIFLYAQSQAQRYLSDYDSSLFVHDTARTVIKRLENLSFSGYIQPQFQMAESKGSPYSSYASNNLTKQ